MSSGQPENLSELVVSALNALGPSATAVRLRDYLVDLHGCPEIDGT
jgi:hypothetical protein